MTDLPVYLIEANVILRFLLNDRPKHMFGGRDKEIAIEIPIIALTETVFSLHTA